MKQKLAFALEPIQSFFRHESSSGILLLFFAVLAMVLANSAWAGSYEAALAFKLPVGSAEYHLNLSVLHWINDGLMAIFFFVIGLEIKREFFFGELQSLSATMLPVCAALGGMLLPALLYAFVNAGGAPEAMAGWGIPMATDIAFSLGILSIAAQGAWSAYAIMPIFALANAGVRLPEDFSALLESIALGIVLGLCFGKPLGVCGAVFLLRRFLRLSLPAALGKSHFLGAGCLAGIGFTMSLFIASLAFPDPALLATAKLGIIVASVLSGTLGAIVFLPAKGKKSAA